MSFLGSQNVNNRQYTSSTPAATEIERGRERGRERERERERVERESES